MPKIGNFEILGHLIFHGKPINKYLNNNHKHVLTYGSKAVCPYAMPRELYICEKIQLYA